MEAHDSISDGRSKTADKTSHECISTYHGIPQKKETRQLLESQIGRVKWVISFYVDGGIGVESVKLTRVPRSNGESLASHLTHTG